MPQVVGKPVTPSSQVRRSTTELPLSSHKKNFKSLLLQQLLPNPFETLQVLLSRYENVHVLLLFMPPPPHDNGRGIKCYPCPSVRTYVQRCLLSKSNTFDQNFMKFGHIVKYHVFFKFNTMLSVVMAICL